MRAFRFTAPHRTELATIPQPEPGPGQVLVKVGAAGHFAVNGAGGPRRQNGERTGYNAI